jgi:hypothetical protein
MKTLSLSQWCAELERQIATVKPAVTIALHEVGDAAVEIAQAKIGHYQDEVPPFPAWPELADSTKADRVRQGYPADEPLLRTGELRDSISHHVEPMLLEVGSVDPVMKYQEHGTDKIPPRPVIGPAMLEIIPVAQEILGGALADVLAGGGGAGRVVSRGR